MSDLLEGKVELDPTVDFVAGTAAGISGLVVGFPLDTVKVRFQNPQTAAKYRSTLDAVSTIIREERFFGLYKGITSPLASSALLNGLVFASYRFFMKLQLDHNEATPTLTQITLAGVGTGIVSSILTTPIELISLQIVRTSGLRGLYRGITATALRDTGYGAYFLSYEATCRALSPLAAGSVESKALASSTGPAWWSMLIAGGIAGVFGWVVTFPFDVVKTRIQGTHYSKTSFCSSPPDLRMQKYNLYRTTVSTIINSYRAEGISVFFRGLAPTLLRAIPVNMVTFTTFEAVVHAFA
ncbi:Mitochondrial carnitine/acylcarnitine carrier protein CACL [Termitomyces sp. J132]|nr:Mitochondrial carnitine/acylcarnitine carrier protein CACL [Termitomyces sp. J132]